MLFAMKEGFKRASITAFKTATRRTKAATIVTTTVRTAGPGKEAAKQGIKTAKTEKRTATKWKELLMKTTKPGTNYSIKATELIGKIGTSTEATKQIMKTAMTTGSKGKAVTKMTETAKKVATAGTEAATTVTKTVVKTATTGKEAALQTMRTAIEATSNVQAATKTKETAKNVATAGTEAATKAKKVVVQTATTGKEAVLQAMRTAVEAASREQATKKTIETAKKIASAGTEASTNVTKTIAKTATTGTEAALQAMRTAIEAESREQATKKTIETAKKIASAGTEAAPNVTKTIVKTATTGTEAALQAMRTAIEAESREQAAQKTIETTKKAVIAGRNTATTGAEAVRKTTKAAVEAATTETEDAVRAMKSSKTVNLGEKAVTKTVTGQNTESDLKQLGVPAPNAMQSKNLNGTMHASQKQINELISRIIEDEGFENVIISIKTDINPDTKEKTKVVVLKPVSQEDEKALESFLRRQEHGMQTDISLRNKALTEGGVRANKGSEICVKDVNITSIGRISVNEGFDTQPDDQPIIRFLRRLSRYIDVEAFMTFIKAMLRNKRIRNSGKMLSKHIFDQFIPGSFMILNLADGVYQIRKGDTGAGLVYLISAGLYFVSKSDNEPTDTMEGGATQSSVVSTLNGAESVSTLNGETPSSVLNGETPISVLNGEASVSTLNGGLASVSALNGETIDSTLNGVTPVSTLNGVTSVSTLNGETTISALNGEIKYEINLTATSGIVVTVKSETHDEKAGKSEMEMP